MIGRVEPPATPASLPFEVMAQSEERQLQPVPGSFGASVASEETDCVLQYDPL